MTILNRAGRRPWKKIANLFNRDYFANAAPDIPPAKGFDFSLGLNMNF
jgi:hypothetical protein